MKSKDVTKDSVKVSLKNMDLDFLILSFEEIAEV